MNLRRRPKQLHRLKSGFSWTDENFEQAKADYLSGKSAETIRKEIGCPTRSAVIGKMHRAEVSKRLEPRAPKLSEPKRKSPVQQTVRNIPPPIIHEDTPMLGLNIMQLRPFHAEITSCRWPIGGTGAEMKFCGRNTRGKPYCRTCRKLSVQPMSTKQKSASMRGALWAAGK